MGLNLIKLYSISGGEIFFLSTRFLKILRLEIYHSQVMATGYEKSFWELTEIFI